MKNLFKNTVGFFLIMVLALSAIAPAEMQAQNRISETSDTLTNGDTLTHTFPAENRTVDYSVQLSIDSVSGTTNLPVYVEAQVVSGSSHWAQLHTFTLTDSGIDTIVSGTLYGGKIRVRYPQSGTQQNITNTYYRSEQKCRLF